MVKRVLILGAGAHGQLLREHLESDSAFDVIGFTDSDPNLEGEVIGGIEVFGGDSVVGELWDNDEFDAAVIGVGDADLEARREIRDYLGRIDVSLQTYVHSSAEVAKSATIGEGSVILPLSYVGKDVQIEDNVVVYSSTTIEHDCEIQSDAYVSPGAVLCGNATIGKCSLIGANATILPGVSIGRGSVVGAGSVALEDVSPKVTVTGVPATPIED